jgi:hypothetical protein
VANAATFAPVSLEIAERIFCRVSPLSKHASGCRRGCLPPENPFEIAKFSRNKPSRLCIPRSTSTDDPQLGDRP